MRPTQFPERIQREDGKVGLLQMRSDQIRKGLERAPHRSLLYADGMTDEELKSDKPLIAIISSQADIIPGHNHLQRLVNDVKAGIYMAGGIPMQFGTIGVCDGIAMNHEGMKYSLTSREVIADSVECAVQGHAFDGVVLIPSCDKIVPGMIMGALRVNLPTVLVSGGPMLAGRDRDRKTETDLNTLFDDKVYLSHHDNGKPYLENNPVNISITHTEKYVAVILHEEENVGIDIESLDRDFSAVEKKALSEDEIDDLEDEKRNEQLAIYWCAKEAVFKLLSRYNVDFAEQIEIERFRPRGEGELEATFTSKKDDEEEFDLEYITFDRHVLVWVVGE